MIPSLLRRYRLKRRDTAWLEITPPASVQKTPDDTTGLYSVIHGMINTRRLLDKLLRHSPVLSFEIRSTKSGGIRYMIQTDRRFVVNIEKAIAAYIPEAKVVEIKAQQHTGNYVVDFKQTKHYIFPLSQSFEFEKQDPLTYVTNAMTKLDELESITLQLIISPIRLRETGRLAKRIRNNEDMLLGSSGSRMLRFDRINDILFNLLDTVGNITYGGKIHDRNSFESTKGQRPARSLSAFELELMKSMNSKVGQALFSVNLRVIASGKHAKERVKGVQTALNGFNIPLYQSIKPKLPVFQKYRLQLADSRLPSLLRSHSMILSAAEIAGLYHFPSSRTGRTDNLITSLSQTLPAPVSLKDGSPLSVLIGENRHHGIITPIGLTEAERERHLFIIGGTGNGKTTMLLYAIVQDIKNGKGVAVIDPHGDLAETLLRHIPESRIKDVIYMNPDDLAHPIGMNLLELDDKLAGDELEREKDLITESTISVMRKIFSDDDSGGHRIEYVLRNTIQTALTIEDPTLFTIFNLLNDNKYRRKMTNQLKDENLKNFWRNEIGKAGGFQRVKMTAGITAKVGRFLFSASAKRVLEQPKSTIDFSNILDSGKILICNFSKGLLGEDTSALFGTTILAKLQLASLKRDRTKASSRRPFYLYVDEFQNFATTSFLQMLSEARKYKLYLTMAEQSTSQQNEQRMVNVILANVGTVVCFRSGSPADEQLILPLFSPFVQQGMISNLPAYSYYIRIAAMTPLEPMSGMTVLLGDDGDEGIAKRVVTLSRKTYGTLIKFKVETTSK
jgi:hypothetical protein